MQLLNLRWLAPQSQGEIAAFEGTSGWLCRAADHAVAAVDVREGVVVR